MFIEKIPNSCDEMCKLMLSNALVLAYLLKYGVPKYRDVPINDIVHCLNSNLPTFDPNDPNSKVLSLAQEDQQGKTILDQYISTKYFNSNHDIDLFLNVEAQGTIYPKERLKKRTKVYCARLIHDQLPNIQKSQYEKLCDVCSMWVILSSPKKLQGKVIIESGKSFDYTKSEITPKDEKIDDSNLVVIFYLGESENVAIQLLNLLFDTENREKNNQILKEKFHIEMDKESDVMCSVDELRISQGIKIGRIEGREEQMIAVLKNLMSSLTGGLTEAMDLLKFSDEEKIKYTKLMSN